ncbi:hypothetical protein P872_00300 [Rhodonellum psychrophilum GCM71 = DSM 17998]|uniref:Uncharacterized protein n=1 Tax=Rhodonellum psychrophilum GCM71 = DSM 17998 TaxID=1123057 RepID=U5BSH0_9BACT|nr:hypothetical protein P872_00300 [Rhodonellum psychrophilum GCM71 = DSM 17998]
MHIAGFNIAFRIFSFQKKAVIRLPFFEMSAVP